jgi:hypothetical protein
MTEPTNPEVAAPLLFGEIEDARVHIVSADKMAVEFQIKDLVRRLMPESDLISFCGGCNGCMGCSM